MKTYALWSGLAIGFGKWHSAALCCLVFSLLFYLHSSSSASVACGGLHGLSPSPWGSPVEPARGTVVLLCGEGLESRNTKLLQVVWGQKGFVCSQRELKQRFSFLVHFLLLMALHLEKLFFPPTFGPFALKITWSILLGFWVHYMYFCDAHNYVHSLYIILFSELVKPNRIVSKVLNFLEFQVFTNISILNHIHFFDSKYNFRVYFWEIPVFIHVRFRQC